MQEVYAVDIQILMSRGRVDAGVVKEQDTRVRLHLPFVVRDTLCPHRVKALKKQSPADRHLGGLNCTVWDQRTAPRCVRSATESSDSPSAAATPVVLDVHSATTNPVSSSERCSLSMCPRKGTALLPDDCGISGTECRSSETTPDRIPSGRS